MTLTSALKPLIEHEGARCRHDRHTRSN